MRVAIAFSTKDQTALTKQTAEPLLQPDKFDLFWCDGSKTDEGQGLPESYSVSQFSRVLGGPDAGIAWKLSTMLASPENYTHVGLAENDVLLADGWFEETMRLFDEGAAEGLTVGAVSPRSYVDRCLIQRDGWAVMLNIGAGFVIFTREAAELVLRSFRTGHWPTVRYTFAQIAGIDVATYACFGGRDQMVTTDWQFEAQLASHGLASLALTPAKVRMIGQNPPLKEQGLELTTAHGTGLELTTAHGTGVVLSGSAEPAFERYCYNLAKIRDGLYKSELPGIIHRDGAGMLFFPHQLGYLAGGPTWAGTLELVWTNGFGPFSYRAGPGGASLGVQLSSSCCFLCSGGTKGAVVKIQDTRSGFNFAPDLPPDMQQMARINVPGGPVTREIRCELAEGAVLHGLSTTDPQMLDANFSFDWAQLPEAK